MSTHTSLELRLRAPASPDRVFPLLCPVREHDWIDGWRADVVHSRSGFAEPGCVFTTPGDGGPVTWVIHRHEPCRRVGFTIVSPGSFVEVLEIALDADGEETAMVWARQTTALGPAGDAIVAERAAGHPERHRRIERALGHYLAHGERLPRGA